jgi:hypothetical protein
MRSETFCLLGHDFTDDSTYSKYFLFLIPHKMPPRYLVALACRSPEYPVNWMIVSQGDIEGAVIAVNDT